MLELIKEEGGGALSSVRRGPEFLPWYLSGSDTGNRIWFITRQWWISCTEGKHNWSYGLNGDVNRRSCAFPYYPRMRKLRYFLSTVSRARWCMGPSDGKAKPAANQGNCGPKQRNGSRNSGKLRIKCGDCAHRQLIPCIRSHHLPLTVLTRGRVISGVSW